MTYIKLVPSPYNCWNFTSDSSRHSTALKSYFSRFEIYTVNLITGFIAHFNEDVQTFILPFCMWLRDRKHITDRLGYFQNDYHRLLQQSNFFFTMHLSDWKQLAVRVHIYIYHCISKASYTLAQTYILGCRVKTMVNLWLCYNISYTNHPAQTVNILWRKKSSRVYHNLLNYTRDWLSRLNGLWFVRLLLKQSLYVSDMIYITPRQK